MQHEKRATISFAVLLSPPDCIQTSQMMLSPRFSLAVPLGTLIVSLLNRLLGCCPLGVVQLSSSHPASSQMLHRLLGSLPCCLLAII